MARPVTLFTGQWADLPFETLCGMVKGWGYDGLEIACWGDHLDPQKAAKDPSYAAQKKETLAKHGLGCWAIGAHIIGQLVGDAPDPRNNAFAPAKYADKPEEMRKWASEEMKYVAQAAKNMGVGVVTCFTGSPVWKYLYSFPPTTEEMMEEGYRKVVAAWSPIFDEFDRNGVKFALEVHPGEIAYDVYTMERLLAAFDGRKTLGINFDPSHLVWQGMNPALFLRHFKDRIYHIHMKDAKVSLDGLSSILGSHLPFGDLRRGWNFVSLGHGSVNFDDIIREANAAGYTGPLSVEWEDNGMDREFGAKEACEFVHRFNFSPSTIAFDKSMEK